SLEPPDVSQVGHPVPRQLPAERLFFGGHDLLLQPVGVRRPASRAPGPGPPFDLEAGLPEGGGRGPDWVVAGVPTPSLPEGEDAGPVLGAHVLDLLVEPEPGALELL